MRENAPAVITEVCAMAFLRNVIALSLMFEHDPFGKPVPTFPDHALTR